MKTFLLKHKRTIIFWIVFLFVLFYFAPRQHDYYLDDDVRDFKRIYLTPILIWMGVVTSLLVFFIVFLKTKSFKQSSMAFLFIGINIAFCLLLFQDLFLGAALFVNRQFKRSSLQKVYVVSYTFGEGPAKDNFMVYDFSSKRNLIDAKLLNALYKPGLKLKDTVTLQLNKGLFGIEYQPQSFMDK